MLGFIVLMGLMFSSGGGAKSRQFAVVDQLSSGHHGRRKRVALFVSFGLIVFGSCGAFAGVAADDARRNEACVHTCTERDYAKATVRLSEQRDPDGRSFNACVCEDGPEPGPLELRADDLPSPPS